MTENMSFDRMRNMLTRAAEIRESEQQQIFDALDEIHARMSPLESLGSVRKRLSELPDRTEVGVLAERLDEALAKLESQEGAVGALRAAIDGLVDKLAKPFAQLDGRLDGVAGRFDGVAGRMDGLEDKLTHIHKRLDELALHLDKQDGRLEALPATVQGPLRERIEAMETSLRGRFAEIDEGVHEHLDGTREAVQRSVGETGEAVRGAVSEVVSSSRDQLQGALDGLAERPAVDPTDRLDKLAERLDQLTDRLDEVSGRVGAVEENVGTRIASVEQGVTDRLNSVADSVRTGLDDLSGTLARDLSEVTGSLSDRPDTESMTSLVRRANEETERRHAGQLDEAMATFAELILGGGAPAPPPPTSLPRQQRRARSKSAKREPTGIDDIDGPTVTAESA